MPGGPGTIDRYVPQGGPLAATIVLLDPHKLDYSVTYTHFSEWYHHTNSKDREKDSITKDEVQAAYDKYKDELNARLAKLFVNAHKNDEWFKERYLPGERETTRTKIIDYRKGLFQKWKIQLQAGAFDDVDREVPGIKTEAGEDMVEEVNRGIDDGGLKPVLLIKTISPTVSRVQLEELAATNLQNFHFVSLSDPNPLKKFHRIGFILLKPQDPSDPTSEPAPVDETTVELLNGKSIHDDQHGDFVCHVGIHNGPTNPKAKKLLNEYMSMPQNLRKEAELVEKCIKKLEMELAGDENSMSEYDGWEMIKDKVEAWGAIKREKREESEEEGEEGTDSEVELKILKKKIDIGVEYLRRTFNFCMYCVSSSDSIHELTRKCPGGHIRRATPFPDFVADQRTINWTKNWQDKLELFVNPPKPEHEDYAERLKKIGGRPVKDALEEETLKFVKQEEEGKYRCKVLGCTKLFKAEEFWRKHLDKKHTEWLAQLEQDAALVNAYVSDPTRVHPPKVEQNAQGNFQTPGMAGNRNPQQMMTMGFPTAMPMSAPFPFAAAAFMHAAVGAPHMNGNGMIPGAGPIRRGRGQSQGGPRDPRYGGSQPYARPDRAQRERERDRRDREMREAQSKKTVGGTPNGGAPAGGPEAELAVMGRAVKSYKDLDATATIKKEIDELDY
ncbi:Similar to Zinc finger protein C725.08; acc. no. O94326 [Pyronema omphalodes CBS 100304]|uniref:Similar to Zinc finger protein C725.08 acc. no. O94326 n=1 Tax=Pyronema omphalodes (strain CBS 100304) TaxID=1076935 RepID=U4LJV0_PYROM|nr:Similar to Zinc finger protein C725.08; acc. no. O94326 [Pyronema omphalodes CBS 100304]